MEVLALFVSLLLIAFFSGIETAFISANKLRVELLKERGSRPAKIIHEFTSDPSRFISTMLIGLNIALVVFGSVTSSYFTHERFPILPEGEVQLLLLQTLFTTVIILVFGELIPKLLFRINSDQSLLFFAYPTKYLFYLPFRPFANLFHSSSRWIIKRIFRNEMIDTAPSFTAEDLEYLVKESAATDVGEEDEETDHLNSEIFERALYLKEVKVRQCMVPRPEIQGIDIEEGIEALRKKIIETKLSRIFIYDESLDKLLGYAHHFDLLKNPKSIREVIRPLQVIPETMTARDLMAQFIRDRKNVAWVVDEYGGTAGIITLEDLMEEIFGEIEDEHDEEELTEKKISDHEFLLSGRLEVAYLNEEYDLNIPEGDYATLGGYILSGFEDIPDANEALDLDHFHIQIIRAEDNRIDVVNLKVMEEGQ